MIAPTETVDRGSISMASTCAAPTCSARLTSLPEPAPITRTSAKGGRPASRLNRCGSACGEQIVAGAHLLVAKSGSR